MTGRITDSAGNVFVPEDAVDYIQAALANRITDLTLSSSTSSVGAFCSMLEAGQILAPFLVVDGTIATLLDGNAGNDPDIYFPFLGANSDSADHVRLFGNNAFGFEMPPTVEPDFDDLIIQVKFS